MKYRVLKDGSEKECGSGAMYHDASKRFMEEIVEVCRKHGLCLVPSYGQAVCFHDPMMVCPLDEHSEKYVGRSMVFAEKEK